MSQQNKSPRAQGAGGNKIISCQNPDDGTQATVNAHSSIAPLREQNPLEAALRYARRGWPVFPCRPRDKQPLTPHGFKDATTDEEIIYRWWSQHPQANIGIPTGPNTFVVLDVDTRNGGDETLRELERQHGELPQTVHVLTGGGGDHYWFRPPATPLRCCRLGDGLEIKAEGGYVVAPPSIHPSGRHYVFEVQGHPDDVPLADMPQWLLELAHTERREEGQGAAASRILPHYRNTTLTSLAGTLRRRGMGEEAILAALRAVNEIQCDPPLPDAEVRRIARSVASYPPGAAVVVARFYPRVFTQSLLAEHRFLSVGGDRGDFYRYDPQQGLWLPDAEAFIEHYFRSDVSALGDEQKRRYVIGEIIADVRGLCWRSEGLPEPEPWLIPFKNGIYDLQTGELREFVPEDYFTWSLPWKYNPKARSTFIAEKLENFEPFVRTHFWELLAYCLWRGYPYQRFFVWFGRGSNGKGFLANVITYALGVSNVSSVTLSEIQNNRFAPAALYRKLANIAGEVSYADLENTDLLKKLTGNDWLLCERKYREPFPFKNHAKLLFLTNQVPKTRDTTDAFYRRTFLVHFERQFVEDPKVLNQLNQLGGSELGAQEFEWVLYRAVQALHELVRRNFEFTGHKGVEDARREYEALSNPLPRFLEELCERTLRTSDHIPKHEFKTRFATWLEQRGYNTYSDKRLAQEMSALGIESKQKGREKVWSWVGIRWR